MRRDNAKPQILMGKRSADHASMPNKYVFPGGKVDLSDARIKPHHDLHPEVLARLMMGCESGDGLCITWRDVHLVAGCASGGGLYIR